VVLIVTVLVPALPLEGETVHQLISPPEVEELMVQSLLEVKVIVADPPSEAKSKLLEK
jgi:hypothetical protein